MEKRAFERLPVNLQLRLFYGNMVYSGIVTNLSERGMFVCTKMSFPVDSVLIAILLVKDQTLKIPIKISRTVRQNNYPDSIEGCGVGVRILDTSKEYMDFVSKTRASLPNIDDNNFPSDPINPSIDFS